MGTIQNYAVIVTGYEGIEEAHRFAVDLMSPLVSPLITHVVNGDRSFFVAPDGSKLGWDDSEHYRANREHLVDELRRVRELDVVVVGYGELGESCEVTEAGETVRLVHDIHPADVQRTRRIQDFVAACARRAIQQECPADVHPADVQRTRRIQDFVNERGEFAYLADEYKATLERLKSEPIEPMGPAHTVNDTMDAFTAALERMKSAGIPIESMGPSLFMYPKDFAKSVALDEVPALYAPKDVHYSTVARGVWCPADVLPTLVADWAPASIRVADVTCVACLEAIEQRLLWDSQIEGDLLGLLEAEGWVLDEESGDVEHPNGLVWWFGDPEQMHLTPDECNVVAACARRAVRQESTGRVILETTTTSRITSARMLSGRES